METKINIEEILKNKPKGTKLYNLLYNIDVELDTIVTTGTKTIVWCTDKIDNNDVCHRFYSEFGTIEGYPDGLQILLPSKEMRDWHKFAWKKGDVLVSNDGKREVLFKTWVNDSYTKFVGLHCLIINDNEEVEYDNGTTVFNTNDFKGIDAEDAVQTYINTIEERFGGKINRETLEVEKPQPEFKDGDIVMSDSGTIVLVRGISLTRKIYYHAYMRNEYIYINQVEGEFFSRISRIKRFATDSEKQQLFDALAKEGKRWDSEKKQIVDLKPKCEFKPFDKVLSRRCSEDYWVLNFYSHKTDYYHVCIDGSSNLDCIPYNEETAHLLGTTDEWKGGEQ